MVGGRKGRGVRDSGRHRNLGFVGSWALFVVHLYLGSLVRESCVHQDRTVVVREPECVDALVSGGMVTPGPCVVAVGPVGYSPEDSTPTKGPVIRVPL